MITNPYQTLGIEPGSSPEEIKQAYRRLASKWHPDRHSGSAESEEMFKRIRSAYEALTNPQPQPKPFHSHGGGQQINVIQISLRDAFSGRVIDLPNMGRLHIRAGTDNNTIQHTNQGHTVLIRVAGHPQLRRERKDLLLEASLTLTQAIHGCTIKLKHLSGKTLHIPTPPGAQPGQLIRCRGQGMPDPLGWSQPGDLFVKLGVRVPRPDQLSETERQLFPNTHGVIEINVQ